QCHVGRASLECPGGRDLGEMYIRYIGPSLQCRFETVSLGEGPTAIPRVVERIGYKRRSSETPLAALGQAIDARIARDRDHIALSVSHVLPPVVRRCDGQNSDQNACASVAFERRNQSSRNARSKVRSI